ncbi:hypothetical protein L1887_57173 [Cichorium endivia]|nr:hypothetical protein L1887_57173 [Cichorium endivia]
MRPPSVAAECTHGESGCKVRAAQDGLISDSPHAPGLEAWLRFRLFFLDLAPSASPGPPCWSSQAVNLSQRASQPVSRFWTRCGFFASRATLRPLPLVGLWQSALPRWKACVRGRLHFVGAAQSPHSLGLQKTDRRARASTAERAAAAAATVLLLRLLLLMSRP